MAESLVQILAGLALLFLAQGRIYERLEELVFHRLRAGITRVFQGRLTLWLMGVISALLLQASRIPASLAGQLVTRRILSVEQAFTLTLGAAIGSSLKSWLFAAQVQIQVALLFLGLGFVMSLFQKNRLSLLAAPLIAAGCFWASLELIWQGLLPFLSGLHFNPHLSFLPASRLLTQLWWMLLAVGLVVTLRSATLVVFLILQTAWLPLLNMESGSALILGANLGMGLFLVHRLNSPERIAELAWMQLMYRLVIGLLLLCLFPSFYHLAYWLVPGPETPVFLAFRLATVHILINCLMSGVGSASIGVWRGLSRWLRQNQEPEPTSLLLTRTVRRMLQRAPDFAQIEIEQQLQIALEHTKRLTDLNFRLLTENQYSGRNLEQEVYLFETIQHSIYDLILPLYASVDESAHHKLQASLRAVDHCSQLYAYAYQLQMDLDQGIRIQLFVFPSHLSAALAKYQKCFNEVWLALLLKHGSLSPEPMETSLDELEDAFLDHLNREASDYQIWVHRVLSLLRQQSQAIYQVYYTLQAPQLHLDTEGNAIETDPLPESIPE